MFARIRKNFSLDNSGTSSRGAITVTTSLTTTVGCPIQSTHCSNFGGERVEVFLVKILIKLSVTRKGDTMSLNRQGTTRSDNSDGNGQETSGGYDRVTVMTQCKFVELI